MSSTLLKPVHALTNAVLWLLKGLVRIVSTIFQILWYTIKTAAYLFFLYHRFFAGAFALEMVMRGYYPAILPALTTFLPAGPFYTVALLTLYALFVNLLTQ